MILGALPNMVEVIFIEEQDPDCPYGAKGVGEIGLVPTAAAVNGALTAGLQEGCIAKNSRP